MTPFPDGDDFARLAWWLCDRADAEEGDVQRVRSWVTPLDRLLWWLSEKGEGSWDEFRRAYAWVTSDYGEAEPAWIAGRDLQALGHVEFAWEHGRRWSAAPPVLTLIPSSGGLGYLTGARTRALVQALREAQGLDFFPEAVGQGPRGPHGIFLSFGSPDVARELAGDLGIAYTFSVADVLAELLPQLPDMIASGSTAAFPLGFERDFFDPGRFRWRELAEDRGDAEPGLYRVRTWGRSEFRFVTATGAVLSCQPEPGAYEALRYAEKKVIRYDPKSRMLSVPALTRLPPLHARAATLASGLLPTESREGGVLTLSYANVSPLLAEGMLSSLSQTG